MTGRSTRFDSAGWGAFFVLLVLFTGLFGWWLYTNRENSTAESAAAPYVAAVFFGAIVAAFATALLNTILQRIAARRMGYSEDGEGTDTH